MLNTTSKCANPADFSIGDRVTWVHVPRGGWGFGQNVAAVVRKCGAKRVQIEVRFKPAYSRSNGWESELKWVDAGGLKPRAFPCEAFGEDLTMQVGPFVISAWKHPNGRSKGFENGTFYGAIDGHTTTAPCATAERTLPDAHHALIGGGYRAGLLASLACYRGWLDQGVTGDLLAEAHRNIKDCCDRLLKLFSAFPDQRQKEDPSFDDLIAIRCSVERLGETAPRSCEAQQ